MYRKLVTEHNIGLFSTGFWSVVCDLSLESIVSFPRCWTDLVDPFYKDLITVHGYNGKASIAALLLLLKEQLGSSAVSDFAANIRNIWHLAEILKRLDSAESRRTLFNFLPKAAVLRLFFPESATLGSTLPGIDLARAFIVEVLLSFVLMFVILNVSTGHMEKGIMAGVAVGATIALVALVVGPLTSASMNPARSLAPALLSGNLSSIWLYLAAPVLGTLLAHLTCRWIQGPNCCVSKPEGESPEADCNDKSCG